MFFFDYLREQAEEYRKLAEATEDPAAKKEFLELAAVCEKVANEEDDRQTAGQPRGDAEETISERTKAALAAAKARATRFPADPACAVKRWARL